MTQVSRVVRSAGALAIFVLLITGCTTMNAANPVGVWDETSADDSPTLSLHDDGTVTGFDGCNQLTGSWEPTDFGVNFGDFAATRMFCEGVDTWLSTAASADIGGDEMTVKDTKGKELGVLARTDEVPEK